MFDGIIKLLSDPRRRRSWRAEQRLIAIGRDAVGPLIEAASTQSKEAKLCIVWALGCIGDPRAFDTLIGLTRDSDEFVRYEATWALGKLGDKRAIEPLIEFLDSDDEGGVNGSACNALCEMGDIAVPRLIEVAKSSTGQKQIGAIYALGDSKNEAAISLLEELAKNPDESVRDAVADALDNAITKKNTPKPHTLRLIKSKKHASEEFDAYYLRKRFYARRRIRRML